MKAILVELKCITSLHVGNGDVNYNIIDNEVERDPVTKYPTINASGIKGALRSYFDKLSNKCLDDWFGSNEKPGQLKFLQANMMAIPMRATDESAPYHLVYTTSMLEQYKMQCEIFGIENGVIEVNEGNQTVSVEGMKASKPIIINNGPKLYNIEESDFKKVSLPVIARNHLENGISQNLWYEEVVPHESEFYFIVCADEANAELLDGFANTIKGQVIQFGGNASIGYGLCMVNVKEAK